MAHRITDANKNVIKVAGNAGTPDINTIISNLQKQIDNLESKLSKRYLTSSYKSADGSSWYNIYSDGWKECGGTIPSGAGEIGKVMSLPVTFSDNKYNIWYCNTNIFDLTNSFAPYCDISIQPVSASTFKCTRFANYSRTWQANGY